MPDVLGPGRQKLSFMQRLGAGVQPALETGKELVQYHQAGKAASKLGLDPEVMQALDPQTRNQVMAEALRYNTDIQRKGRTAGINLQNPEGAEAQQMKSQQRPVGRGREFLEEEQGQRRQFEAPEFTAGKGRGTQGPGQPSPSMMPQVATTGQKVPVLDPRGVIAEGKRIQQESMNAGVPMDQQSAWQLAHQQNEANKAHNAGVEGEQETERIAQRDYGNKGESAIANVYPEASDEVKAIFRRKGEELASQNKSEAAIDRALAVEARKFANMIANVRESIGPPRSTSTQKLLGTGRDADAVKISLRNKLKPLLDEGLYDTARNELSKLGYHPEERETILADVGEGTRKALAEMPQMKREKTPGKRAGGSFEKGYYTPPSENLAPMNSAQKAIFKNSLTKVFENDPSTNLILLRKQYEDKGVDWRSFSEALNDMIYNEEIKLNPDQFAMLDKIDMPPLNELDKILHGAQLIGR